MLRVPDQWRTTQGAGVRVAVLDSGIDAAHPDLATAIDDLRDFTGSEHGFGASLAADRVGHGTHTAGIIARGAMKAASSEWRRSAACSSAKFSATTAPATTTPWPQA
ncbi:MAG: S8 family serine peptidase [Pirellulales bacterium]